MEEEPTEPSIPEETETTGEVEIFPYLLDDPSSSLDVELAVAFMVAEVNREKGGGLIRKTPEEVIMLFSKIGWPYWFMKTKEGSVIADGQGLSEQKLTFSQVPKPEEIDNILSSSEIATDYVNSLKRTIELLTSLPTQSVPITALVEPELAQNIATHKKSIEKKRPLEIKVAILEPEITKNDARTIATNFDELMADRDNELKKFDEIKKTIEKNTSTHFKKLDDKTRETLTTYSDTVTKLKEDVDQEIVRLKRKKDEELKNTDIIKEEEGKRIVKKLRTTFDPVQTSFSNAQKAVEDYVESKIPPGKEPELAFDLAGGAINYIKSQIDSIGESLKATEKDINNLKEDWKKLIADVEAKKKAIVNKTEEEIANQNKRIKDKEVERDKKINELKEFQKTIENLIKELFTKIDEQKKRLLEENSMPKKFLIPETVAPMYQEINATYLPLYITKYSNEKQETRFIVLPAIASLKEKKEIGIDIGDKKLHSMIYTSFNEYVKKRIEDALSKNKNLRDNIERIMNANNFIKEKTIESTIQDGIKTLEAKKVIKDKDAEEFALATIEAFRGA
ncbi:hypothetical protein [Candidatus Borrarchaeum sp.]|uniref:hypothetical protein n=1 Tax=Candidatus Borrarchaeum sp. TaxID=2846742 RepID=UPI00257F2FC0|nr:hypothetical protein [Candidatus Borrarchaeum sp.]